jgi:hypothetical protein
MIVDLYRLTLNDDDPDLKFLKAQVMFRDDDKSPHRGVEVWVFLEKDDKMTISEIRAVAVQKARDFLLFAANFPPSEYHQRWSYESTPEEDF